MSDDEPRRGYTDSEAGAAAARGQSGLAGFVSGMLEEVGEELRLSRLEEDEVHRRWDAAVQEIEEIIAPVGQRKPRPKGSLADLVADSLRERRRLADELDDLFREMDAGDDHGDYRWVGGLTDRSVRAEQLCPNQGA